MEIKEFNVIQKVERMTYPQDWPAYDAAKTKEKLIAQGLLMELLDFFDEDEKPRSVGRPSFTLKEQILCMHIYCYSRFSSRRAISDIELAKRRNLLSKTPHFTSVMNMFKLPHMTNILCDLVEITSMPMRMFEEHFSIDSSGFSTSMFERWVDMRTQKPAKIRAWKKVHIISGARTNIISAVGVTEATVADCPQLIPLVEKVAKRFEMKEFSADKAYLSRNNLKALAAVGAVPYIPFKSNSTENQRGCRIWKTMFTYFTTNQAKFMERYHLRSNVESTFSMIKRNYGNRLRTRKYDSQINEILMKCLCHNLSVLVQESFEHGLDIDLNNSAKEYYVEK
jgi:transposase